MANFYHVVDILRFNTEGLLCLLLTQMCGAEVFEKSRPRLDLKSLDFLAAQVVNDVWHQCPVEDIRNVLDSEVPGLSYYPFCTQLTPDSVTGRHIKMTIMASVGFSMESCKIEKKYMIKWA